MFQQNIYDTNYGIQSMETCDLNMQSKYLLMQQDAALPGNNLLDRAVEQLNDPDADLLNLLATEEDCTSILQNIASNEQFESLINNDSDFHTENLQNFMDPSYCEKIPYIPNIEHNLLETIPSSEISAENPSIKPIGEFKCAQCDKPCTSKKMLRYHLKTHSDVRPYACEICNKRFRQKYEVTAHKRSHTNPSFQCDICSKMFVHKSHLTSHRRKHVGDFDAFCEDCNKGFITKSAYQNHIKIHHEKLLHICDICGQQLSTLSSLNEHKNIHDRNYGKDRTHICDICGKSYLTARNLKTHLKTHMQLSTYVCNICGKSLSSKKVLETHVKMHIGEKDFVCQYCNKSFAAKEYLTTHIRTHTGDKPYSCHICDKSFTQRTTLTVHLRYHTGERPYKCHCGKGYITKSHLISHYKTHEIPNIDFGYDLPS